MDDHQLEFWPKRQEPPLIMHLVVWEIGAKDAIASRYPK